MFRSSPHSYAWFPSVGIYGFRNALHRKRFTFDKNVAKKSVTQEFAASIFLHSLQSRTFQRRAGGIAVHCVALLYGILETTRYSHHFVLARPRLLSRDSPYAAR